MPFDERIRTRELIERSSPEAYARHPGTETDDPPTIPPAPKSPKSDAVEQLAKTITNWKTIGGFLIVAFLGGFGVCSALLLWQLTSVKEHSKSQDEKLTRIEAEIVLGFKSEALSRSNLAERVAKIEGQNVVAHESKK